MKKIGVLLSLVTTIAFAQEETKKDWGSISGGLESNSQYYVDDEKLGDFTEDDRFRSNNYLRLDYTYKKFSAGIQVESYEPQALLNYSNPMTNHLEGTNIGTFYARYRGEKLDVTAGSFYEQFGSGLILRSWEDRQLGINNSLLGGRVIYNPIQALKLTGLYGKQREGLGLDFLSDGQIFGFDAELDLSSVLEAKDYYGLAFSWVGRDEDYPVANPDFNTLTNAFSGRFNYSGISFYGSVEFDYKTDDVANTNSSWLDDQLFDGQALLVNLGYTKNRFGVDATFRRMENMAFYSDREVAGNQYNQNIINYVPALTKQQDYNLSNIYVYQAQPAISFLNNDANAGKAGEIGGQIDVYYTFKRGSALGGKYGTKLAVNYAQFNGLDANFDRDNLSYSNNSYLGFGEKFYQDINIEIKKKWSKKWQSIFTYVNQYYNKAFVEETIGEVNTDIVTAEAIYRFAKVKSIRVVGEHLWTKDDRQNWASATLEFNFNTRFSAYVMDLYNYGNDHEEDQIHYYNVGGSVNWGATRVAVGYGRQRGGLVCVGGVCRYVPENTGFSLQLSTAF